VAQCADIGEQERRCCEEKGRWTRETRSVWEVERPTSDGLGYCAWGVWSDEACRDRKRPGGHDGWFGCTSGDLSEGHDGVDGDLRGYGLKLRAKRMRSENGTALAALG
jgi:hypothetical protein